MENDEKICIWGMRRQLELHIPANLGKWVGSEKRIRRWNVMLFSMDPSISYPKCANSLLLDGH